MQPVWTAVFHCCPCTYSDTFLLINFYNFFSFYRPKGNTGENFPHTYKINKYSDRMRSPQRKKNGPDFMDK